MRLRLTLARVGILVVALSLWELISGTLINEFFISKPSVVISTMWNLFVSGEIIEHLLATFRAAAFGYVAGAGSAIVLAVLLSRTPFLDRALQPFLMAFYGVPRIALAPLFIIWFGIGLLSKVVLVASVVFFIVFMNTLSGLREADGDLVRMLRSMGASEAQTFRKILLPAALPWVGVGLRIGVPYAFVGAIIGELLAASRGLGYLIQRYGGMLNTGGVLAIISVLALIVVALNGLFGLLERRAFKWKGEEQPSVAGGM